MAAAKPATAAEPTAPSCADCRFWSQRAHLGDRGECHRYPPAAAGLAAGQFAMTKAAHWCGEHQAPEAAA